METTDLKDVVTFSMIRWNDGQP